MMISRSIVDVIAWAIDQLAFLKAKQQKGFVCHKPSGLLSYVNWNTLIVFINFVKLLESE